MFNETHVGELDLSTGVLVLQDAKHLPLSEEEIKDAADEFKAGQANSFAVAAFAPAPNAHANVYAVLDERGELKELIVRFEEDDDEFTEK